MGKTASRKTVAISFRIETCLVEMRNLVKVAKTRSGLCG